MATQFLQASGAAFAALRGDGKALRFASGASSLPGNSVTQKNMVIQWGFMG